MRTLLVLALLSLVTAACSSPIQGTPTDAGITTDANITTTASRPDRSPASQDTVTLTFINHATTPLNIYWLTFEGDEKLYQTLAPQATYDQPTYVGHIWIARTPDGKETARITASRDQVEVVID
ncbi:VHL beta domain-containing protein [Actinokineospora diospyrosa]|uniref:von Hippel-Lindau disease tumor suppressor protein n=1 Tax=Actinokineospora diospyrosa TaxID=103728 RepID=A0ABT1IGI2_9PSEU|nr:hypothetical protein [Actinokineospora diospyrosa]MCP2271740.1 von Hippel-Lindau disease tumor suppressor protein [Actinokineospora diospyrosa]